MLYRSHLPHFESVIAFCALLYADSSSISIHSRIVPESSPERSRDQRLSVGHAVSSALLAVTQRGFRLSGCASSRRFADDVVRMTGMNAKHGSFHENLMESSYHVKSLKTGLSCFTKLHAHHWNHYALADYEKKCSSGILAAK